MLKKTFCSFTCIMHLLILSNVVSAQEKAATFSVTPYLGGYLFDNDQNLDNNAVYGISLGYNFTNYLGVDLSGEYIDTKYDLPVPESRSTNVYNYRLDGIVNLIPDSRLVPFLFAGFGGQSVHYPQGVSNRVDWATDYGAGLKYFFTEELAVRALVRQIYIFDNSWKDNEYTLGLTFYFGGSKPAPVSRNEPIARPVPEPIAKEKVEEKVIIMASEPKIEEKVVAAAAEPKIVILAFEDVHFDFGEATLKPEAQRILKRNVQLLKENPKAQIRIAGYTSAAGTEAYNQKLSERRANAVKEYLVKEGVIAPDRLSIIGYGETKPAVYEAAPKELYSAAAKANMRVLFEIIVK